MRSTPQFRLEKSRYPIVKKDGGVFVDAPVSGGKLVGHKRPDGTYRRQCGEYVNDAIGIPSYFQDKLSQKRSRITTQEPKPGSIAILDVGTVNGHVTFMEILKGEGSDGQIWQISESNPLGTEHFRRITTTTGELKRRGLLGYTEGLNMDDMPSTYAVPAFAAAAAYGYSDSRPLDPVDPVRLRQALLKLPACTLKRMAECLEDNDKPLMYQDFIMALWKAGAFPPKS